MHGRGRTAVLALAAIALVTAIGPVARADDVDVVTAARLIVTGPGNFGFFSVPAGDVNGDGRQDLLVSAYADTVNGRVQAGQAWVVFGLPSRSAFNITTLGTDGFRVYGAAQDQAGSSLTALGDVNGDGKDDILVGAPFGNGGKGVGYVVFGKADTADVDLSTFSGPHTGGYRILGNAAGARLGSSAATLGDLNGDGRKDVVLGALFYNNGSAITGAAYAVYSQNGTGDIDVGGTGWGYLMKGAAQSDTAGQDVAGPGDVNGDGTPDILIGAPQHGAGAHNQAGAAYVVFGKGTPPAAPIELASLGSDGIEIDGAAVGDQLGFSVSGAGDTNGDGKQDVAVGAIFADHHARTDSGTIYVVRGRSASGTIDLQSAPANYGYPIDGDLATARLQRVSSDHDLTGDGLADTLVESVAPDALTRYPVWVVPGQAANTPVDLAAPPAGSRRLLIKNSPPLDVEGTPDLDGDGHPDVLIGTSGAMIALTGSPGTPLPPGPTPPGPTPPAPVPAPAPAPVAVKPKAAPKLATAGIVVLPSAKGCVSRRNFRIHLRIPKKLKLASASVSLNGKRVKVVKGRSLSAPIDLRGLPKGRFTVAITLKATDGRTGTSTRRYRTCAPKRT